MIKNIFNLFMKIYTRFNYWGSEIVLGKLFTEIGFEAIEDVLFKHSVIARVIYPVSKLKTIDYLQKYKGITLSANEIYRYLDKLHSTQIKKPFYNIINSYGKLNRHLE